MSIAMMHLIIKGGDNMEQKVNKVKKNQKGNAMLITTIILLVLAVIVATVVNISGMQYDLAVLNRNTSNTYYLAKSALEKHVDTMNKAIESQMSQIVKDVTQGYTLDGTTYDGVIKKLKGSTTNPAPDIVYSDNKLQVKSDVLKSQIQKRIYEYIKSSFLTQGPSAKPPIEYKMQGDRIASGYDTTVTIETSDQDAANNLLTNNKLRIIATATTSNGATYDTQKVEAIIEVKLPTTLKNQIHEKYEWKTADDGKQYVPEILNSSILCFSDVFVTGDGNLTVSSGDVRVSGKQSIAGFTNSKGVTAYPEVDQNGGVLAVNGGEIYITNNLYCTNNVLATNGWGGSYGASTNKTYIEVGKDIIAYTVGIIDDYYETSSNQSPFNGANQVKEANIKVKRNVMVDNDVMIDRWVDGCKITVDQSIFGVNAGTDPATNIDPNQSSGIFAQGKNCIIDADEMYVVGQPYITLAADKIPMKLWESIGEPFNGVASWEGYVTGDEAQTVWLNPSDDTTKGTEDSATGHTVQIPKNSTYLLSTSPLHQLIANDKIQTNFSKTYAIGRVSGKDDNGGVTVTNKTGQISKNGFNDENQARRFMYIGLVPSDYDITNPAPIHFKDFMSSVDTTYTDEVQKIIKRPADYLAGGENGYFKNLQTVPLGNYQGLRGYMTLQRAILYKSFSGNNLNKSTFADTVDLSKITATSNAWSYQTPISVLTLTSTLTPEERTIDVSKFYVDVEESGTPEPYETIIVNKGEGKLIIDTTNAAKNKFTGIIISKGAVEIKGGITIDGAIIIGGPESAPKTEPKPAAITDPLEVAKYDRSTIFTGKHAGLIIQSGQVTITHNPNVLFSLTVKNHELYRQILTALKLVDYSETVLPDIMGTQTGFTKPMLAYTNESILEIDTEGIQVAIQSLKKAQ